MRKHKADMLIMILMMVLLGIGLLVIYTIGPVRANFLNAAYGGAYSENYFFVRQLISVGLSLVTFFVCFKFLKYEWVRKISKYVMFFALGACLVLAVAQMTGMSIAKCSLGACRWFELGPLSLQPAEFLKIGMALYLAQIAVEYRRGKEFTREFWIWFFGMVAASLFFVVVMQKDLGSALPIAAEALAMLLVAGVDYKTMLGILGIAAVAGVLLVVTSPHRMERLATYFGMSGNSSAVEEDESGAGLTVSEDADSYHIENALIAIGSGGFWGVGIGNSVQATGYLPESINDSVFAIMGETFGLVGLLVILGLFTVLLLRILKVADTSADNEVRLVVVGIFAWLMTHVVVNIMAMTGLVPLTGITLPLLSYGGTSMMCVSAMIGLVMQFSERTERKVIEDSERMVEQRQINLMEWRRR